MRSSDCFRLVLPNLVPAKRAPANHPVGAQPMCIFLPGASAALPHSTWPSPVASRAAPWLRRPFTRGRSLPATRTASAAFRTQKLFAVARACSSFPSLGGWGPTAVKTWRELGGLYAARLGLTASEGTEQLLQSLRVTRQRENARAVLRRLPEVGPPS